MKFLLIRIFILTINCLLCYTQMTAKDFTLKFIQNTLNSSEANQNFVVAPYEAFNLYQQLFSSNESNENDGDESNEITQASTTILKQQKVIHSSGHKNVTTLNLPHLLTTISLKARWTFNFQSRDTHKHIFYQLGSRDNKIYRDFLRKDDTFRYAHDEQLNASILELPLNMNEVKLMVILPDVWDTLPELRDYLIDNIATIDDLLKHNYSATLCRVSLPKFQVSHKLDLNDFYQELSSNNAKRSGYDNIEQLSSLDFNESGIGELEKTTVLFWNVYSYLRIAPEVFDINHPFIFMITNADGVQFFGQIVKMFN